ncbi:hypothetical protein [Chengkuizengella axinellae]|uniref:DUF4247 domain-containing protein n=1 Tax=Chengkuizengella axinellae TaxID=3064388 RepID=A0ABT9IZ94_9BACL|nr:hypothetical protein [Chengkuizengella sp. 2205SS18-9]MDP5274647.1 hypothetical protein [Chengkuizengella sp. 2205SS18-9]
MKQDQKIAENLFYKGKPLKTLSTTLGIALVANLAITPFVYAEGDTTGGPEPTLVEWSSEDVKQYFDANMDWNIPLLISEEQPLEEEQETGAEGGNQPVYIHNGFGWDDLLLYHLIFNSGRSYSTKGWYDSRPVYDARTNKTYKPKAFESGTFQNKPVVNSSVRPKTVSSEGNITKRDSNKSTSTSSGSIGNKSSNLSSTSKSGGSFGG